MHRRDRSLIVIHVLAEITLAPGARDAFVVEFARLTPLVRVEDGCIEYQGAVEIPTAIAKQAAVRPEIFTVIEKWRDEPALAAHLVAPHMDAHRANAAGLSTGTIIRILASI